MKRATLMAAGLGALLACLVAMPASAATFAVNTTADPAGAGCAGGTCSFRQAADAVNAGPGSGDTINLPAGHYVFALGDIRFDLPVTIVGAGARSTILDANLASGVLYFQTGSSASTLAGVTVTRGSFGGIYNEVNLTVRDVAVVGNTDTGTGAGLYNNTGATLTVERSTISGNTAGTVGAGIYNQGTLNLTSSTVSGNIANTSGGGWEAGGVYNSGTATIVNSTIAGNRADAGGGIDASSGSMVNLKNTIIAANTATGTGPANCTSSGTYISQGNNLEDADTCNLTQLTDLRNTAAGIGSLQNNGGPTDTRALLAGSAAIDRGANSGCPATDQRGVGRPIGTCDIGAYEFAPPGVTTGSATAINTGGAKLAGTLLPNLRDSSYYFQYGVTTAYGSTSVAQGGGAGNSPVGVNVTAAGLKSGTTYHFRLVAVNAEGTSFGSDATFKTSVFNGARLASRTLKLDSKGRVRLRLGCPSTTAGSCAIRAGIYSAKGKLPASLSRVGGDSAVRKARRLGRGSFSIAAGKTQSKRVRLSRAGRKPLKRKRTLRARLLLTTRDAGGNAKTRSFRVKVKRNRG